MLKRAVAYIDLDAIYQNIAGIKAFVGDKTKVLAVVKADAYGHGSIPVSKTALKAGASMLGVATVSEGIEIQEGGVKAPILVLGPPVYEDCKQAIEREIRICAFTLGHMQFLSHIAKKLGKKAILHIKIDTGMGRIGVAHEEEFREILEWIQREPLLELEGIFTHFSDADNVDKSYTLWQNEQFERYIAIAHEMGFTPIVHASNSPATLDLPQLRYDYVRAGIAIYGCYPARETSRQVRLTPALSFKSFVIHLKQIQKGQSISYGRTFVAPEDMVVATVPVGYGDGYKRILSNRADVLICGKRARVLGNVCMDQMIVDVTHIPEVAHGSEVVMIGKQGGEEITADELAELAQTINYEILLSISKRVPRVYLQGGEQTEQV